MDFYRLLSRSLQGAILLTLICAVVWFWPFFSGTTLGDIPFVWHNVTLFSLPYWIATSLQFAIFVVIAVAGQRLTEVSFVAPVQTYVFYGMMMCLALTMGEMKVFTVDTVAFALVYLATNQLFRIQTFGRPAAKLLNITMSLVLAACIDPLFALLLPLYFIALIMMRQMNLRAFVTILFALVGCGAVIVGVVYLLDLQLNTEALTLDWQPINIHTIVDALSKHIWLAILLIISFVVIFLHQLYALRYKTQVRTLHRILSLFCLFCWVLFFLLQNNSLEISYLIVLFSSLLFSSFFSNDEMPIAHVLYPILILLSIVKATTGFLGI
ncbi:MAG: hypothetical protein Q4D14_00805 [Bacteroidales bacterium]|nr:hypothetical protein [Bacteroidales bacterium]